RLAPESARRTRGPLRSPQPRRTPWRGALPRRSRPALPTVRRPGARTPSAPWPRPRSRAGARPRPAAADGSEPLRVEGFEGDEARPDETRFRAKHGRDDADEVARRLQGLALNALARRLEQEVAGRREPAADDDDLGVEDVHERADAASEPMPDLCESGGRGVGAPLASPPQGGAHP